MLAFVLAQLTAPVEQHSDDDGAMVMTGGEPAEAIVRLTESEVTVAEFAIAWRGPYTGSVEPIAIGTVHWTAISAEAAMRAVKALVSAAREARLSKFRGCGMCGQSTPPEWMHDDNVCQECAERDLGVVH
jgi:hypothetical protein